MVTQGSVNSMVAHNQWARRPRDERYTSLEALTEFLSARKQTAAEAVVDTRALRLGVDSDDPYNIVIQGREGSDTVFTHYSFGQMCERIGTRRTEWSDVAGNPMPAQLAVPALQYRLEYARTQMENPHAKLYFLPPELSNENGQLFQEEPGVMMAFTGPKYGRIYDYDVARKVMEFNERQGGQWHIPAASYQNADPKRASTLYASDHDVWIMLVNTDNPIDDGSGKGALYKLLIVSNSEVGDARFWMMVGYYNTICDNRIIWGLTGEQTVSLVHNARAPERFEYEAMPALMAYADMSTLKLDEAMKQARKLHIEAPKGAEDVTKWLQERGFSATASRTSVDLIQTGNAGAPSDDPTNLWNIVNGLTAYARGIEYTDDRIAIERQASKLLDAAYEVVV